MSNYIIPISVLLIIGWALFKGIDVYEQFVEGVSEGLRAIVRILPNIMGMTLAIAVLKASGLLEAVTNCFSPICSIFKFPAEVIPLAFMRPISGSGAMGILNQIINDYGPDSYVGYLACVMMGSTETTLYTASIYLKAAGLKRTRYIIKAGLLADLVGIICSIWISTLLY